MTQNIPMHDLALQRLFNDNVAIVVYRVPSGGRSLRDIMAKEEENQQRINGQVCV